MHVRRGVQGADGEVQVEPIGKVVGAHLRSELRTSEIRHPSEGFGNLGLSGKSGLEGSDDCRPAVQVWDVRLIFEPVLEVQFNRLTANASCV
jgi:hypothetical protein